ncbi:MAG: ferrous iron transport protein B [Thermodesulfobacteriota bacterium]
MKHDHRTLLVALAGQPNCGKSTIFNMLTGARQHVANYPGVTVDKKWGSYATDGYKVEVVDLPGTYSLTSYSQEERIARDFILLERPEVVVAVVDAANLERSLYLVFQLRELEVPMVLCLNMMDVAEGRGFEIDMEVLSSELGMPVVSTVAKKGKGKKELKEAVEAVVSDRRRGTGDWSVPYGPELEAVLERLTARLEECDHLTEDVPGRWLAVKLMENDIEARRLVLHHPHYRDGITGNDLCQYADDLRREFLETEKKSPEKIIAASRYRLAAQIGGKSIPKRRGSAQTLTDKIDAVLLQPALAPIILALILLTFYQVTMVYGTMLADWIFPFFQSAKILVVALFPKSQDLLREGLLQSLVVNGLVGGIVAILYYLPIFLVLFACIAILEDSGYMARIAFIMDRVLRGFGLHGQSTLPMILGGVVVGGCAVPGIMATRAMKDEKARLVTILIMPLMNCLAKIPFYILIVGLFFAAYQGVVLFGISLFSFVVALAMAKIFSRYLVTGEPAPFVMELPAYHVPTVGGVLRRSVERTWLFIKKIVTIVAAVMVVVWFFVTFPGIGLERELYYDRQLQQAEEQLLREAGSANPYRAILFGPDLAKFLGFKDRYAKYYQAAGDDQARLKSVQEEFASEDPSFFVVANRGQGLDGTVDKQAAKAAKAVRTFEQKLKKTSRERRKEIIDESWAGRFGRFIEPVTSFAGFNWRINIAIISSFAAKESLVGTLGTIYSAEEGEGPGNLGRSIRATESGWTLSHALAILVFVALIPPCLATLIMIKNETGRIQWMIFASIYPIVIGFILACVVFQMSRVFA